MKCDEVRRFAHLYIDREFDDGERFLVEAHLAECDSCRSEVHALAVFQQALRRKMGPVRVPAEVRERLEGVVSSAARPRRRLVLPAAVAATLAVAVAAGVLWYRHLAAGDDLSELVEEAVATHEASLPPEVEGDAERIRSFLAVKGEEGVHLPLQEDEGTRLVGARLTRIGKSRAVLDRYLHKGRQISVLQLPRRLDHTLRDVGAALPRPGVQQARVIYSGPRDGHSVTAYESPGCTNAVVGDIPQAELLKLVPTSL